MKLVFCVLFIFFCGYLESAYSADDDELVSAECTEAKSNYEICKITQCKTAEDKISCYAEKCAFKEAEVSKNCRE